ncbi:MAG: integrase arm-type DNA-binding domain-containing protein, partial [Terracidiphilus sp.]
MPLTEAKIKNAKPQPEKAVRLYDRDGLYLEVAPSGGKWWRIKYRFAGRENRLSLGVHPEVSLRDARERRDEARKLVTRGIDPSQQKKIEKAALRVQSANTFEAIAREWHTQRVPTLSAAHAARVLRLLERDVFPFIGLRPIAEIEAPELLSVLRRIEARGVRMTTHRARIYSEMVFRYAIASGRSKRNPAVDVKGALAPMPKGNFPAITDAKEFGNLLRTIGGYKGTFVVESALKLAPML